jgi:large subunit ribosomal protein L17
MLHRNATKKLGRVRRQRLALMRSLARSLIIHERIETTEAKAKALRPFIEKLVTRALKDSLATRRILVARLDGEREAMKLINDIAPKYEKRNGGYTRISKVNAHAADGRDVAVIEFV